jgi:hypothetical protein
MIKRFEKTVDITVRIPENQHKRLTAIVRLHKDNAIEYAIPEYAESMVNPSLNTAILIAIADWTKQEEEVFDVPPNEDPSLD